jgi:peptide/nickel transport system ATP-binding protein
VSDYRANTPDEHLALEVEDLYVRFGRRPRTRHDEPGAVVSGISFSVRMGECLALVGESGSGKSVTARTLVGLTGDNASVAAGRIELNGLDVRRISDRQWRAVRGKSVGFILQDALVSLDALRPVGREIAEPLRLHHYGGTAARREKVIELLRSVGVPEPEMRARQLPHELSGGLRQRALIASAIALDPDIVIADEPTTALDTTVQAQILGLLEGMKERGKALLVISHDLSVVSRLADRVAVMRAGEIVEEGTTSEILGHPTHPYTRALLDAVPSTHRKGTRLSTGPDRVAAVRQRAVPEGSEELAGRPVLEARQITKRYKGPDHRVRTVVDDVSFELFPGETLGVVGESGSGKTTIARIALALTDPDVGDVVLGGEPWSDIPERARRERRRLISVVHQDPLSSFDPRWRVGRLLEDALPPLSDKQWRNERIRELLSQVGLGPELSDRRPLQLSGGQRQRVALARALAAEPRILVCDEPVSALDVSIQAQVLDLLAELQERLGLSYLFISHDLGVIYHMSDRILVLKDGRVVESGTADEVFRHPRHEFTRRLLSALPMAGPDHRLGGSESRDRVPVLV